MSITLFSIKYIQEYNRDRLLAESCQILAAKFLLLHMYFLLDSLQTLLFVNVSYSQNPFKKVSWTYIPLALVHSLEFPRMPKPEFERIRNKLGSKFNKLAKQKALDSPSSYRHMDSTRTHGTIPSVRKFTNWLRSSCISYKSGTSQIKACRNIRDVLSP